MRARSGLTGISWILPFLLLLPPLGNMAWEFHRSRTQGKDEGADGILRDAADLIVGASYRQDILDLQQKLDALQPWSQGREPRFRPVQAELVRVADPSPKRSAFLVWTDRDSLGAATIRTPVVNTKLQTLVGRLERIWPDLRLARVQTVQDRFFRVRFRYGKDLEGWGFLGGTGLADGDGRPLLEIRHLGIEVALQEGDPVVTDGNDGVFPAGIPIGTLVNPNPSQPGNGLFKVRSYFSIGEINDVILLVDQAIEKVRELGPEVWK